MTRYIEMLKPWSSCFWIYVRAALSWKIHGYLFFKKKFFGFITTKKMYKQLEENSNYFPCDCMYYCFARLGFPTHGHIDKTWHTSWSPAASWKRLYIGVSFLFFLVEYSFLLFCSIELLFKKWSRHLMWKMLHIFLFYYIIWWESCS